MKFFESGMFVTRKERWVEDSAPAYVSELSIASQFLGAAVSRNRILIFGISSIICLCVLFVRVIQLQIVQHTQWNLVALRNRLRIQPIISERGILFDRNMVPLVANVPNFRLTLRAQDLPQGAMLREQQIRAIGETVHVAPEKIDQVLEAFSKFKYASVVIKEPVSYEEAVNVYLHSAAYPSLTIERGAKRKYVAGIPGTQTQLPESMSHVLGYLGRVSPQELESQDIHATPYYPTDVIGKTGLEASLEPFLRGVPGERGAEVDAHGVERRTVSVVQGVPGNSVVLTIDLEIQRALESALKMGLQKAGQRRGAAIAIDPRDGSVLGLVSEPAYNNNAFADTISVKDYGVLVNDTDQPLVNRAIGGQLPSGSTIKPFMASAALQENVVTPETTVHSTGGIHIGNRFFADWKAGGHGTTDIRKAIAESVNTYFYTIGGGYGSQAGLGPARIKQYLEYFGFNKLTGIALPGEATGFLPSPAWKLEKKGEQWYIGDTYNISIGQGDVLVTPLQLAMGLSSIVNNGILWKPRMVSYFVDAAGIEHVQAPEISAKIPVDPQWLQVVREGMRQTVVAGSARSLNTLPIMIAGKTGTAQWSSTKAPHAWFESYAPYNEPEIVTLFLVEEGREGATVCVPAAKQFYEWWAKYRKT